MDSEDSAQTDTESILEGDQCTARAPSPTTVVEEKSSTVLGSAPIVAEEKVDRAGEESKETPHETQDEKIKLEEMLPQEFFIKSFEALWNQADIIHKRQLDKWEEIEKRWDKKLHDVESNLKQGIYKFSKDLLDLTAEVESKHEEYFSILRNKLEINLDILRNK